MDSFSLTTLPLVAQALKFFVSLFLPIFGAIIVGAVVGGLLRLVTRMNDDIISFFGRFVGLALGLYIFASHTVSQGVAFAARLWGGGEFYF